MVSGHHSLCRYAKCACVQIPFFNRLKKKRRLSIRLYFFCFLPYKYINDSFFYLKDRVFRVVPFRFAPALEVAVFVKICDENNSIVIELFNDNFTLCSVCVCSHLVSYTIEEYLHYSY